MKKNAVRNLVLAAFFLALGLILPFLTGQIPEIGRRLLPMHIPALLGGFILGGPYGLLLGFILPPIRSLLFGMPPLFPVAVTMMFEMAVYGLLAGLLYKAFPKKVLWTYAALILAMIGGRIVWGVAAFVFFGLAGTPFTVEMFIAGALVDSLPGILLQIVIIPPILIALEKSGLLRPKS